MKIDFIPYEQALALKELGFEENCLGYYVNNKFKLGKFPSSSNFSNNKNYKIGNLISAPLYQQAINFLYICSNKKIYIELKGSDTYEERIRKIEQGCKDLWKFFR